MSDHFGAVRMFPNRRFSIHKRLLGVPALVVAAVGIAYESANGEWIRVLGLLVVCLALLVAIHNWRWSIYGLLLYLPVSGVPTLLAYSNSNLPLLLKDVLFVLPAYVGFALLAGRNGWRVPGAPVGAIAALTFLVIIESFNPSVPNPLVALIGIKVWLLYIPLVFLGYHFVRSKEDLRSVVAIMVAAAMVPAGVGLAEAIAIHTGHSQQVYALYGPAGAAATQGFFATSYLGGGFLARVPSTFSFAAQYFAFLASMVAVGYAWWRLSGRRLAGALVCLVLLVACFTSGARAAFVMIPLLIGLIILLDGRLGQGGTIVVALAAALFGAASLFGADPTVVFTTAANIGQSEVQAHFLPDMTWALRNAVLGLGTGESTISARYAMVGQIDLRAISEAWFAKVMIELGLVGILTVVFLFGQLLARAYKAHRRIVDPSLKAFSSAIIAFLIMNLVWMTKGAWIDIDPINVYFWLFAGMVLRIGVLDRESSSVALPNRRQGSGARD